MAYRALCWELYQKQSAVRASPVLRDLLDRGKSQKEQIVVQGHLDAQRAGFAKGLAEAVRVKRAMDQAFSSRDFSDFAMVQFALDGPLGVASTGGVTPNQTISAQQLQILHDDDAPSQWMMFGVDTGSSGPSAVFLWSRADVAPQRYMEEILSLTEKQRAAFLVQFFFAHCENTYFAANWWNSLTADSRRQLELLMANGNPYYFPPKYDLNALHLSPWRAATIRSI